MLKLGLTASLIAASMAFAMRHSATVPASPASDLAIVYGSKGMERLSYKGVVLEDLAQDPSDSFHIWHMRMTGLDGTVRSDGQYGWGENNSSRIWDSATRSWTYRFVWGTIVVRFIQTGERLDVKITAHNNPGSGVILHGATIYPLVLHFPQRPRTFTGSEAQLAFNSDGPSVTIADYGTGEVAAVVPDAAKPLYTGFIPAGQPNAYTPILSGAALDRMADFQPHLDRPVAPGETDIFTVSLRFAPSGADAATLASDAYASWAKTWPPQLNWPDRRMIGTIYLASSPSSGDVSKPGGFPNNPRRYFNDGNPSDFDVHTPEGLGRFQRKVLRQAKDSIDVLRRLHAQGAITWDIEGEEYPQETSYICAPDQIARIAPEMESLVKDRVSPYAGMKLDDAWFKSFRDAGFRVGVCIRPQRFTLAADATALQVYLPDEEVAAELVRKMKYAHDRWGATLFYLDSTVQKNGAVLDASIFQKAAAALPDSLLLPEETTVKHYAYTAPFRSFLFHGDLGTEPAIYRYYPRAFSVNLINDVSPEKLQAATRQLTEAVRRGDILMAHAGYWQANNATLLKIYADAHK